MEFALMKENGRVIGAALMTGMAFWIGYLCTPELTDAQTPPAPEQSASLSRDAYPEGVATETEYEKWLAAQNQAFLETLNAASGPPASALDLARHANWILAYYSEPALTREILGIPLSNDASDLEVRAAAARQLLDQAAALNQEHPRPEAIECLIDFAVALQQAALSFQHRADSAALSDAAAGLSIWLDDDQAEVRETARLLQGLLYRELGNLEQALTILPRATAAAEATNSSTAIYARAMRCQVQAQLGQHVLALALLLKMEERCSDWLSPAARAAAGEGMLAWVRLGISQHYSGELGKTARKTLNTSIEQARTAAASADHPGLLRLHPAVPILIASEHSPRPTAEPKPAAAVPKNEPD